jgi:apolipoprotein N-acyltransferase
LRDATTLATRVGEAPEWVAAAALLTMLALGVRGGRPAVPETTKEEDDDDAA